MCSTDAPCIDGARCEALGLTAREREVVAGVVRGLENKQIARELRISIETVKNHLKRIFERAQVESRAELVRELLR